MKEIKEVVTELGESIISSIKENMEEYGQGDSNLAKSLRFEADEESLKIFAADYFEYAQKGRPGGKIPKNFDSILESWITRHKISFDGDKRVFARNVAWNIYKHGTKMYREGEERDFLKDVVEKNIEKFEKEISDSLIKEIRDLKKVF